MGNRPACSSPEARIETVEATQHTAKDSALTFNRKDREGRQRMSESWKVASPLTVLQEGTDGQVKGTRELCNMTRERMEP